jgi:hypothetical protein
MEEHGIAGLELAVDMLQSRDRGLDSFGIGTGLVADDPMVDPTRVVRSSEDLETPVGSDRAIDGDHATGKVGEQAAIF